MTKATKVRLQFAKGGDLRLASHHDVMRCLERMVRRAALPVAASQGFSPRPKIVFALAMGLGIEGRREIVDFELTEPIEPLEVLTRLAAVSFPGFEWLDALALDPKAGAPRPVWVEYDLPIPEDRRETAATAAATLMASASREVTRRRHDRDVDVVFDLRPFLIDARMTDDGVFRARLKVTPQGSVRPEELLASLGIRDLLDDGAVLVRTHVELAPD
jgi:radical SAM-linked protein